MKRGFTLIEISIVLVIIGLIVGGILVGKTMVDNAEARSYMKQMEQFQVATTAFKLKYNCIPGDCVRATSFGLSTNCNGDGFIGGRAGVHSPTLWPMCLRGMPDGVSGCMSDRTESTGVVWHMGRSYGEHQLFWAHLSGASLIDTTINALPDGTDTGVELILNTTYPKDSLKKNYLLAAMWGGKLYIRTGLETVTTAFGDPRYNAMGTLSAGQAFYATSKLGYDMVVGVTNFYPNAFSRGQRVVPTYPGQLGSVNNYYFYLTPETTGAAAPACAILRGSEYFYNVNNNGRCDLLWQIDVGS